MATYFPALDCYWCGGTHPKQQICNGMYPMQHGSREARMHGEILRLQKLLDTRSDGPNGGWNDAVEAAAKLLRASADACTPGSPAEQQNWPFVLETMAREVSKLRLPATPNESTQEQK